MPDQGSIRPRISQYTATLVLQAIPKIRDGESLNHHELGALETLEEKLMTLLVSIEVRETLATLRARREVDQA